MIRTYEHIRRVIFTGHMDPEDIGEAREWCWANGYRIISDGHTYMHPRSPYRIVAEKRVDA